MQHAVARAARAVVNPNQNEAINQNQQGGNCYGNTVRFIGSSLGIAIASAVTYDRVTHEGNNVPVIMGLGLIIAAAWSSCVIAAPLLNWISDGNENAGANNASHRDVSTAPPTPYASVDQRQALVVQPQYPRNDIAHLV